MLKQKKVVYLSFAAVVIAAIFLWAWGREKYVPPILMYHSVNDNPFPNPMLVVTPRTFERQMSFLKRNRYNVISLERLSDMIKDKSEIPPRTVAITFDDGYKDVFTNAFPVLLKYGLPATAFVIVREIGRFDRLSRDDIREMLSSGLITLGSHTVGPEPLTKIKDDGELRSEIFDSKKILEQDFGRQITLFSYPEGRFNAKIRQMVVSAGYKAAVATNPGKGYPSDDIYVLKRLRISENCSNLFIFWVESSGYYTFAKENFHREKKK